MASWPTPKTWTSGAVTAAEFNTYIRDAFTWLKDAATTHGITSDTTAQALKSAGYGVALTTSGTVNLADQSDVQIQFDTETWDDAGFHSTVTNTQRITIPTGGAGRYEFTGQLQFEANSSGGRELWLEVNGATEYNRVRVQAASAGFIALLTSCEIALSVGDYVVLRARQNSGSTLTASGRLQARRTAV